MSTNEIREEYEAAKNRKLEIEKEILKLKREDSDLDQKLIALKAKHPELNIGDVEDVRTAEQKAQIEAITPKTPRPDVKGWA